MLERRRFPSGVIGYRMGRGRTPFMAAWAYRIGGTLIDTGCPIAVDEFLPVLEQDGAIQTVYVTHHHEDHSGNAQRIRERFGAKIIVSQFCRPVTQAGFRELFYQRHTWGFFQPFVEDRCVVLAPFGSTEWQTSDGKFTIIHAPGHSHDMTVVYWPEVKILFGADLYLAIRPKMGRRDEVWGAAVASVARVLESCDIEHLLCAHYPVIETGGEMLAKKLAEMRDMAERISKQLGDQEPTAVEVERLRKNEFGPENRRIQLFSLGDFSSRNIIRSVLGLSCPRKDLVKRVGRDWADCRFEA